jgi:EAL and modified HD-GYP domain-containing signal transduction protein
MAACCRHHEDMRLAPPSTRPATDPGVVAVRPEATEVAVVRLPIADARGAVAGYELLFANGKDGSTPGVNARATAAMIDGAFADIGIDRLTGRHMAWLSVARDFLVAVDTPPVRPDRAILQIAAYPAREDLLEVLRRLSMRGYTLALSDYDGSEDLGELMELCTVVKVPFDRVAADARAALVADLRTRGGQVVATGVDDDLLLAEARELGVDLVQGAVLAQPRVVLGRNAASATAGSLRALADLVGRDLDFDELERIVSSDVALSLKLLRYVNSAFFSLPRTVASVGEALSILGTRAVQRWAMVVVMANAPEAPDDLVALALQRARMCETLAEAIAPEERATLFTIGMFSVADALIGRPMAEVLAELPFSDDVQAALLEQRGALGRLLAAVLAYERGEFPELPGIANAGSSSVAGAYRDAVEWAEDTTRVVRSMA